MEQLENYRVKIDEIDAKLIKLLEERMALSIQIGNYKKENGLPVFDSKREVEIKEKNSLLVDEKYRAAYNEVFETILKVSKDLQL